MKKRECLKVIDKAGCDIFAIVLVEPNVLASGCVDGKIRLFDVNSGNLIDTLEGHSEFVFSLMMIKNQDNQDRLVSGSDDKFIKIWDIKRRNCIQTLMGHAGLPRYFALVNI